MAAGPRPPAPEKPWPVRPEILFPLFAPITSLPGVGPRNGRLLEGLAGPHVVDLVWHLPRELVDRRFSPTVAEAPAGRIATLTVRVVAHKPAPDKRRPHRVICEDETGRITLVYFHARGDYLTRLLPENDTRVVSGRVEHYAGAPQIAHPDHVVPLEEAESVRTIEPVYPLAGGLTARVVQRAVAAALERVPDLPEWQDDAFLRRNGWVSWKQAVLDAHAPQSGAALEPAAPSHMRLAYDELLANQLTLLIMRNTAKAAPGRAIDGDRGLTRKALAALPFSLTGAQVQASREIRADMAAPSRMLRLLQGDVGSGKTIVAFFAMLNVVECGGQAAIMAPTEILARQHFDTIEPLAQAVGVQAVLLTGRDKGAARLSLLASLESGEVPLAIGTHALFQEDVRFKDLMLAVIDEQHRFGVHQRLALASKGKGADMLVMTATPIPRTLTLTAYGDLDVSRLTEKPAGRKPVDTRVMAADRLDQVVAAVERALSHAAKVYWVCPLVEDSEVLDLAAAEERFAHLKQRLGADRVVLVHGRMKAAEKDAAIRRFAEGPPAVLVATTVIEVGVDVPDATVMVVEHAERFGLAQLHQLRGRIGRGERASTCLLLYAPPLGETARSRLGVMRDTDDGFVIAEQDLKLRGAGELLGTRQSGLPHFRLADLGAHGDLMATARDDARLILEKDPDLTGPRGAALRVLLYLFERDAAVLNLRSG